MDQKIVTLRALLNILQLLTTFGTLCIMLYTLKKFLSKPQDTLATRITACEAKLAALETKLQDYIRSVERSLQLSNDNSKNVEEGCKALQSTVYSLIEFELTYCRRTGYEGDTGDLEEAAKELHNYLKNK